MIEIEGVQKSFGTNVVLDGIDLKIDRGEIYGLIGVSGAGKSTLLRCINRLEEIDGGAIWVDGVNINELSKKDLIQYRRQIGMVFQQFSLMERRTVYENVFLPLRFAGVKKAAVDSRIKELLDLVGLSDKINDLPRKLSGGQKQRVAIARALATQPKLLLSDEATSALDPNVTEDVLGLLRRINSELGLTIVVVTHETSVMKQVCTKLGLLHKGELLNRGPTEDFFLMKPENLSSFSRDVARIPEAAPGTALLRLVHDQRVGFDMLTKLAIEADVPFEIVWGGIDRYSGQTLGSFIIQVPLENIEKVTMTLDRERVDWLKL